MVMNLHDAEQKNEVMEEKIIRSMVIPARVKTGTTMECKDFPAI
jgi:hypothetical protein